jgi:hypothetical protein
LFLLKEFGKIVTGKKKGKEAAIKLMDWRYRQLTGGSNPPGPLLTLNKVQGEWLRNEKVATSPPWGSNSNPIVCNLPIFL